MSAGAIFMIAVVAMFPTLILVALVVKLWEIRQASRWPATTGKVMVSSVRSQRNRPGDLRYNFSDTEVSNEPHVVYEYQVGGKTYRCSRITIGEKISGCEIEGILARYPVGAEVTVYYDPAKPEKALLERELPWGMMAAGLGCVMLVFIGGPLLMALFYFNGVAWLEKHLANPGRAPFVAVATGFGLLAFLFGLGFMRHVRQASRWPVTRGRILAVGVDAFIVNDPVDGVPIRRRHFKPSILYTYEVNGRQYQGDRETIGVVVSSTLPGLARRKANRYSAGDEVDVHYNPENPSESVLRPRSHMHHLIWLIAGGMFALAWAAATGRM